MRQCLKLDIVSFCTTRSVLLLTYEKIKEKTKHKPMCDAEKTLQHQMIQEEKKNEKGKEIHSDRRAEKKCAKLIRFSGKNGFYLVFTVHFAIFFWSDSLFHVLQKIIRNGKCELLRCLKLDFPRAYFFRLSHSPNDLCIYRLFKVTNFVIVRVHEILWYRNTCILRVCVCVRSSTQICDYNYKFTQRIMQDVCNGTCQIISNTIFHHNLF